MELNHYLRIVARRWKTVAAVALVTILFTLAFVSGRAPTYESKGTYVVRPRGLESGEVVRATDALNRGVEINSTYARIARSEVVEERARDDLTDDGVPTSGLKVISEVVPGTNIIEIGARGPDPAAVTAYAAAVGDQTGAYLDETGEVFRLQPLDPPEEPDDPLASRDNLTMALGSMLGLVAGAVVAFSAEYFSEGGVRRDLTIYDEATGVYSRDFLRLRFRQEMSRCDLPTTTKARWRVRSNSFTFGLMKVTRPGSANGSTPEPTPSDLRDVAHALTIHLRPEDVLAYVGDDTFALMLPDMPAGPAEELLRDWSRTLHPSEGNGNRASTDLVVTFGVCQCGADGLDGDEDTVRYARTMQGDAA